MSRALQINSSPQGWMARNTKPVPLAEKGWVITMKKISIILLSAVLVFSLAACNSGKTTDSPKDNVSTPQPASVAYSPQNVVSLATAKCQAGGMITTQQNLQNHLNDGSITQEEYNEYYPYDGMEGSYYSVFVETDLNKASTIDGQRLSSEDAIAEYIASMLLLETDPVFYISYDGVYTTGGTDYYEFRCHR